MWGWVGCACCPALRRGLAILAALIVPLAAAGAMAQVAPALGGDAICANAPGARLELRCRLALAGGRSIGGAEFAALAGLARAQGRIDGLADPPRLRPFATPILRHESDINGGNPARPLILGNLVFTGDPARARRAGVVAGAEIGLSLRHAHPPGLRLGLLAAWSGVTDGAGGPGIRTVRVQGCAERDLLRGWFAEGCAEIQRSLREFARSDTRATTLRLGRVFTTRGGIHAEASGAAARMRLDFAGQNRLIGRFDMILPAGWHGGVQVMAGSAMPERHAVRREGVVRLRLPVGARWVQLEASVAAASGSNYVGIARTETILGATLTVPLGGMLRLSAGYWRTRASIDYFATEGPAVALGFPPLRF
jgi:hypothetical protein